MTTHNVQANFLLITHQQFAILMSLFNYIVKAMPVSDMAETGTNYYSLLYNFGEFALRAKESLNQTL